MTTLRDLIDCAECLQHWVDQPMLVHAFASVGIEHGRSSEQMAVGYFQSYHERGHDDS